MGGEVSRRRLSADTQSMSDVVIVAIVGFLSATITPFIQPWVESRREVRRARREDAARRLQPYQDAFAELSAAIGIIDRGSIELDWGSTSSERIMPEHVADRLGRARGYMLRIDKSTAMDLRHAADAVYEYARTVVRSFREGDNDAVAKARTEALAQMEAFAIEFRKNAVLSK